MYSFQGLEGTPTSWRIYTEFKGNAYLEHLMSADTKCVPDSDFRAIDDNEQVILSNSEN